MIASRRLEPGYEVFDERVPRRGGLYIRLNFSSWPKKAQVQIRSTNRLGLSGRGIATAISGIEFTHRIRKDPFDLAKLGLRGAVAPAVENAVLSDRHDIRSSEGTRMLMMKYPFRP